MTHTKVFSAGERFRKTLQQTPLQIVGTANAYCALMAEQVGFQAIYISGSACATCSYGLPDLGITSLENVLEDVWRITSACSLPLLVDIDTGWGNELNIERTIKQMIKAGAAAVHMEDQTAAKRCGHLPDKKLVTKEEMVRRIQAAVAAKTDPNFYIIARTDALAVEGFDQAIARACAYRDAGADAIFAEAVTELDQYKRFASETGVPILANLTEFGKTPYFTVEELKSVGVSMILYPWAATRAMHQAAFTTYKTILTEGTQKSAVPHMQDRKTLYEFLNYDEYEEKTRGC
jgi:methylisocitrate lyase